MALSVQSKPPPLGAQISCISTLENNNGINNRVRRRKESSFSFLAVSCW